jgi:putative nucleotidyltransferase with HDIG domain
MPEPCVTTTAGTFSRIASALERLSVATSPDALLGAAGLELQELLGGHACVVSRVDGDQLHEVAASWPKLSGSSSPLVGYSYLLDDYPLTRVVLDTGTPAALTLSDPGIEPTEAFVLRETGMDAVVMLPLRTAGNAPVLVEIYDVGERKFGEDDVELGEFFVRQVGALLVQFEHTASVQRLYRETLASLANALEEKDSYTHDHTQEVVALAVDVARAMGLEQEDLELVELGALFHDIGKIRVPESILNKKGPLDDEEWGIMRSHTVAGEAILAPITSLREVLPLVRSSHERWDGNGYPDGIAGKDIPVGARVISVCDAFRAMTERRPYREAMSERDATVELRLNAGTQFDPDCVRALLSVLRERARSAEPVRLHRPSQAA